MRRAVVGSVLAALLWCPSAGGAEEPARSLSLEECLAEALREHPALATAGAAVRGAEFRVPQTTAAILPQVSSDYIPTRQKRDLSQLINGPANPQTTQSQTFTFQEGQFALTQVLFDFGRTLGQWRAALADLASARSDREQVVQAIALDVKTAYYDWIAARRLLLVAETAQAQAGQHLDIVKARFEAGQAPRFDLTRQELQVANASLDVVRASGNATLGRENLRHAMGRTAPIGFEPDDAELDAEVVTVGEPATLTRAYERRPELQSIRDLERAQEARIGVLQRAYLPIVIGRADYIFTGKTEPSDPGWQIGADVHANLFDGGLTASRLGEARAKLLELQGAENVARQNVALEVRQAVTKVREGAEEVKVSTQAVDVAGENVRIAETRYRNGIGNVLELTDALTNQAAARGRHVHLLADYRVAVAQLEHAMGADVGFRAASTRPAP